MKDEMEKMFADVGQMAEMLKWINASVSGAVFQSQQFGTNMENFRASLNRIETSISNLSFRMGEVAGSFSRVSDELHKQNRIMRRIYGVKDE